MSDVRGRAERWSEIDITREEYDALQHLIETGTLPKDYAMKNIWEHPDRIEVLTRLVSMLIECIADDWEVPSTYTINKMLEVLGSIPDTLVGSPSVTGIGGEIHLVYKSSERSLVIPIPTDGEQRFFLFRRDSHSGVTETVNYTPEALEQWIRWFYGEPST